MMVDDDGEMIVDDGDSNSEEPGKTCLRSSTLMLLVIPEMNSVDLLLIIASIIIMSTGTIAVIQYKAIYPSLRTAVGLVLPLPPLVTLALYEVIAMLCRPGALLLVA